MILFIQILFFIRKIYRYFLRLFELHISQIAVINFSVLRAVLKTTLFIHNYTIIQRFCLVFLKIMQLFLDYI